MKKNILTSVATATLLTSLTLSSVAAKSYLVESGVRSATNSDQNISIDITGQGTDDANMTFIPGIDASPGSSFTMQFVNGGLKGDASITLCAGAEKVGNLLTRGTLENGLMVNPTFQFDPNADQTKIIQDTNITFSTVADCNKSELPEIISSTNLACQKITAQVVDGKSTQGTSFPDYNTDVFTIGTTKQFIKIACSTPVCFVSNDFKSFMNSASPAGVNLELTPKSYYTINTSSIVPDTNATNAECPGCPQATVYGETTCTTIITIKNDAAATDLNVTKLDFVATFDGTLGADMNVTIDANNTVQGYTLGSTFSPNDIGLSGGQEVNITIVYTAKDNKDIALGTVKATVNGLELNTSTTSNPATVNSAFVDKDITLMQHGPSTQFTVPYMNGTVSSMVRISNSNDSEMQVEAVVTDKVGVSCPVTLTSIPANAASMIFAQSKAGRTGYTYQNLIPTGKCSDLTVGEYSVVFKLSGSANVVSYMTMTNGSQRYVPVF